jgi:S1-C subfamily serine protease
MVNLTGQMGVPVIVIDGQAVIGFDRGRIQSLIAAGAGSGGGVRLGLAVADASHRGGSTPIFGAFVGRVAAGSIGQKAGLQPGDIVTEINQHGVSSATDLERATGGLRQGDVLAIKFLRGSETRKSEIVI